MVVLGLAGCSSSSKGPAGDGGDDGFASYGPPPSDGSADGEGGSSDASGDGYTCNIPAAATFSTMFMGATMGCAPQVPNGQCDSSSFRLLCSATNDPTYVPPPPSSLVCDTLPNNDNPLTAYYCCSCQAGASVDP